MRGCDQSISKIWSNQPTWVVEVCDLFLGHIDNPDFQPMDLLQVHEEMERRYPAVKIKLQKIKEIRTCLVILGELPKKAHDTRFDPKLMSEMWKAAKEDTQHTIPEIADIRNWKLGRMRHAVKLGLLIGYLEKRSKRYDGGTYNKVVLSLVECPNAVTVKRTDIAPPTTRTIRRWAKENGLSKGDVTQRRRIRIARSLLKGVAYPKIMAKEKN